MMNFKFAKNTILITAITSLSCPSVFSQLSNAQSNNYPTDRVSFYCGETFDQASGKKIPTTIAWVPQREANILIVGWENEYFGAWNSQKRCEVVSQKFQNFYEDGRLNYLSNGENAGYPIICALLEKEEQCSGKNQLFQLRPGTDVKDVIRGLNAILDGKTSDSGPIYQSSGKRVYISISGFLEKAPVVEENN
ncbi:MAG: COP23 domain-containing protein [Cyanobacteria bacterium P01_F01_bin.143]